MTQTTTTLAITSATQNQIPLTSVTGLLATMLLRIDLEYMEVTAIDTTALVATVIRGQAGTVAVKHGLQAACYFGYPGEFGGVGQIYSRQYLDVLPCWRTTPTAQVATAGVVTYAAGQLLAGLILRDPNGASRSDVTPTAALLVAAMPGCEVGSTFEFRIENQASGAYTITLTAGTGFTVGTSNTMTIAQNNSKKFEVRITNITPGSEAATIRNLGTFTT